ncbi:MAG: hypothetical protein DMG96_35700 [Acidobacteria bacterium]|nr:MAG: hypothetical protein DMG96_35700 [Acidobacteriota bacterium]
MPSEEFAQAFGDALRTFLEHSGISQSDAADRIGLPKTGRARINTYCHGYSTGGRPTPSAEILYLLCTKLGFAFEYNGYKIGSATLNGRIKQPQEETRQLTLPFDRQFILTEDATVSITVRRPAGRLEVSLSLKAAL